MILVDFLFIFFFFKQKTAYEMRISDWSSDVCSSDLQDRGQETDIAAEQPETAVDIGDERLHELVDDIQILHARDSLKAMDWGRGNRWPREGGAMRSPRRDGARRRSEEHTYELQSLMRISYAVFCLNKQNEQQKKTHERDNRSINS